METVNNETNNHNSQYMNKRRLICLAIVIVLLFFSFMFGIFVGRIAPRMHSNRFNNMMGSRYTYSYQQPMLSNPTSYLGNGPMRMNRPPANTVNIKGVVTAINGQTITVAGNGSTNNITTNSSTQYTNGSSPKVNDTIVLNAQFNNNQLTAQSVTLNP